VNTSLKYNQILPWKVGEFKGNGWCVASTVADVGGGKLAVSDSLSGMIKSDFPSFHSAEQCFCILQDWGLSGVSLQSFRSAVVISIDWLIRSVTFDLKGAWA
jgi:hypothetical protein